MLFLYGGAVGWAEPTPQHHHTKKLCEAPQALSVQEKASLGRLTIPLVLSRLRLLDNLHLQDIQRLACRQSAGFFNAGGFADAQQQILLKDPHREETIIVLSALFQYPVVRQAA